MKDLGLFEWIWDHILYPVFIGLGAAVKWLFDRRKGRADAANTELEAARKAREEWQLLFSEAKETIAAMSGEIREMKEQMHKLEADHLECTRLSAMHQVELETLKREIEGLKKKDQ